MKLGGYANHVARIDLSRGDVQYEGIPEEWARKYIGARGLGVRYLLENGPEVDPLSPDNLLCFMNGPLTGSPANMSGRMAVVTKSPLTGTVTDSHHGGWSAARLRWAGFDGLLFKGRAEKPVYAYVEDGKVELRDASDLWGLGIHETIKRLQERYGERDLTVIAIGPAGENMVKYGCWVNEDDRASGRGGTGGGQSRLRGSDLRYNLEIALEEAYVGRTVEIDVPTLVACTTCEGSGAKPGTGMSTCRHCNGHGKVRAAQGFFTIERTCPVCQGRGQMLDQPCSDCNGEGRRQQSRTLSVDVPKGIEDGTRIRLANEGEAGIRGGPPGDLYIFVSVKPHDLFQRDGADLYARVPIAMTTAALGGEFEVPTLDSARAKVKVAPGTQPGQRVRLKQKGMPVLRSKDTGDLYVQLDVETPQNLTKRQRELLEEFHRLTTKETSPTSDGFFAKLGKIFES